MCVLRPCAYDLIYNTKVVDQVVDQINQVQYFEILDAIQARVKYATRKMSNLATEKVNELLVRMEAFADNAEQMFAGVDGQDIAALMQNLAGAGSVDEAKLVEAVFSAQKSEVEGSGSRMDNVVELRKTEE